MIYIYFFIKSLINLSRNSVRFENSFGNRLSDRLNSVRFYLTVCGMACMDRVFFPYQNNPKNLDPSYKTDLDLWVYLGGYNLYYSKISLNLYICRYSREGKTCLTAE